MDKDGFEEEGQDYIRIGLDESGCNLEPKKRTFNDTPAKFARLMQKPIKNEKKVDSLPKVLPGESYTAFNKRVRELMKAKVVTALEESKGIREKRKSHLQMRKEKKKQVKREEQEEEAEEERNRQEKIKFGEVVQAPPTNLIKPKKVLKQKVVENEERAQIIAAYRAMKQRLKQ